MVKKPRKVNPAQEIVGLCIDSEDVNWAKEVKIAKKLLEQYPDINHWRELPEVLEFKPKSLVFFCSPYGKKILENHFSDEGYSKIQRIKKLKEVNLDSRTSYQLESKPLVNFEEKDNKPKTFKEFLEIYGKN